MLQAIEMSFKDMVQVHLSCVSFPEVPIKQSHTVSPKSFQTKQHHSHNDPNPTSLSSFLATGFLFPHLKGCFKPEGMEGERGGGRPCAISLAQGRRFSRAQSEAQISRAMLEVPYSRSIPAIIVCANFCYHFSSLCLSHFLCTTGGWG